MPASASGVLHLRTRDTEKIEKVRRSILSLWGVSEAKVDLLNYVVMVTYNPRMVGLETIRAKLGARARQ